MSTSTLTPAEIARLVTDYVQQNQPGDYRLTVDPDAVQQEEDWWYVVVRPDRPGVRAHEYAERLTRIEDQIWDQKELHVVLVPSLAYD